MRCAMRAAVLSALTAAVCGYGVVSAASQTVDEIIASNLVSRGGVEKLRSIESVKSSGKMSSPRGVELRVSAWMKRPNKLRREMAFPDRSLIVAFDGSTVWRMEGPVGKPEVITGPQAEATRDQVAIDPLFLDYKEKGHRIELVGTEEVDGVRAHHLRVRKKNGQVSDYFLDAATGLELRTVDTFSQGGMKVEVRSDLGDYRTVEGMRIPFSIKQFNNGNLVGHFTLESVEFNVPMEDDLFVMK